MPEIDFNIHGNVAILTVNRPQVRNALNPGAMADFAAAAEQAHAMPILLALIVTGGDIAELQTVTTEADAERMITLMGDALDRLAALPCITIAAMEGPARGGGCEIALACDWRVAAEDADLGFVQIRLGRRPTVVSSGRLPLRPGPAHAGPGPQRARGPSPGHRHPSRAARPCPPKRIANGRGLEPIRHGGDAHLQAHPAGRARLVLARCGQRHRARRVPKAMGGRGTYEGGGGVFGE